MGLPFDAADAVLDAPLEEQQRSYLRGLIGRRISERMPVAYLIHEAWFAGLPFYVDQRVLIPRSPLAELIESGFSPWVNEMEVDGILDIGTGSGCIAIACALAFPNAGVDATDVDGEVLQVAKKNVGTYGLTDRVRLFNSAVFRDLPPRRYDLILSNPPYVSAGEMRDLPPEYGHEPAAALAAGTDGLTVIREILQGCPDYLSEHGVLVVEVGNSQAAVVDAFPQLPFTWLEFEYGGEGVFLLTAEELKLNSKVKGKE